MICKCFLPLGGLSFHFLDGVLGRMKVFSFDKVQFLYFSFATCAFSVIAKRALPNPGHEDLLLCFLLGILQFQLLNLGL